MRIVVIGEILNIEDKIIGLRLIDIEKGYIKDVGIDNIKEVLSKGIVKIENLELEGDRLVINNGYIRSIPRIKEDKICGNDNIAIIDYKGDGVYLVYEYGVGIREINKNQIKRKISNRYVGQKVYGIQKLLPIYHSGLIIRHNEDKGIITEEKDFRVSESFSIEKDVIKDGRVYESVGYTITRELLRDIRCSDILNRNIPDLDRLLSLRTLHWGMTESINRHKKFNKIAVEPNIGLIPEFVPERNTSGYGRYFSVGVEEEYNYNDNGVVKIDAESKKDIISKLKIMDTHILNYVYFDTKGLVISKSNSKQGIEYKVIDIKEDDFIIRTLRIEDIYRDYRNYSNVEKAGNGIIVRGLDEVTYYNMDIVKDEYNRTEVISNRNIKAKLFNKGYYEAINSKGELTKLYSSDEVLEVPSNAISILDNSIYIDKNTTKIVFNSNIKNCGVNYMYLCMDKVRHYEQIKEININCDSKVAINILKGLLRNTDILSNSVAITTDREWSNSENILINDIYKRL